MSNQNRLLLPASSSASGTSGGATTIITPTLSALAAQSALEEQENQHSVDTDFDSYWEEEARNPNRNRIRIGRQYQASVPAILKTGESDERKLVDLETLTFCPKRSARVSDAELDHYFTVAKSLNLFASLVETRNLLGRDVTIADLNHIRNKEGLSLASVIQPTRQAAVAAAAALQSNYCQSSQASQALASSSPNANKSSPSKSPPTQSSDNTKQATSISTATTSSLPNETTSDQQSSTTTPDSATINQPLMKALSHFISLHHPCHHDENCKKLIKNNPFEDDSDQVSIPSGNLRQISSSAGSKSRSRSSLKQQQQQQNLQSTAIKQADDSADTNNPDHDQVNSDNTNPSSVDSYVDWTREEVELFSKAIVVCGKNFGSIKKEFLPTKSVRSIVEYYYIGSRDIPDSKKKSSQTIESSDGCNSFEKSQTNSHGDPGQGGGSFFGGDNGGPSSSGDRGPTHSSSSKQEGNPESDSYTNSKGSNDNDKQQYSAYSSKTNSSAKVKQLSNSGIKNNSTSSSANQSQSNSKAKANPKNIDTRMSVYNFDDEFKDESPVKMECSPRPGAEVKPLKAKPIMPNTSIGSEAGNSNVGSLNFFMDGQLVLKLNACQDQQEGADKCHWVQSGERLLAQNRQKRYTKKAKEASDHSPNGSQSNSIISSYNDDDSKNEDLELDEDSKESANSFYNTSTSNRQQQQHLQQQAQQQPHQPPQPLAPPRAAQTPKKQSAPKRPKVNKTNNESASLASNHQSASPIDYNRLSINNRIKDRNDLNLIPSPVAGSPMMNQAAAAAAAAASMPSWLQANQFAMAAAILSGLPFPGAAAGNLMQSMSSPNNGNNFMPQPVTSNLPTNLATSKPMDLSLEQSPSKPITSKSSSRSRGKQKN